MAELQCWVHVLHPVVMVAIARKENGEQRGRKTEKPKGEVQ
jgi:hypothetical protein